MRKTEIELEALEAIYGEELKREGDDISVIVEPYSGRDSYLKVHLGLGNGYPERRPDIYVEGAKDLPGQFIKQVQAELEKEGNQLLDDGFLFGLISYAQQRISDFCEEDLDVPVIDEENDIIEKETMEPAEPVIGRNSGRAAMTYEEFANWKKIRDGRQTEEIDPERAPSGKEYFETTREKDPGVEILDTVPICLDQFLDLPSDSDIDSD